MVPDKSTVFAAWGLAAMMVASPSLADVSLRPCHVEGVRESVLCGSHEVPEDHDQPGGRTIGLHLVVVPAAGGESLPDPIVFLAGGPGQAATDMVGNALAFLDDARQRRDIVFIDQRGTGRSNPLDCDLGDELLLFGSGGLPVDAGLDCLRSLEERADLGLYTSFHAARDLEAVRRGLGYGPVNLWGGSYGTRMAMVYDHLFPASVRSMVLDGSAPFEVVLPQHNAREAQRAFDLLTAACASDPLCKERYPDSAGTLRTLLDRLGETPETVTVDHPRTGMPIELTMTPTAVAGTLRVILYHTGRAGLVPWILDAALRGDFTPLVAIGLQVSAATRDQMHVGMTFSVLCSEDFPRLDRARLDEASAGTFLGTVEAESWIAACATWPKADLPEGFHDMAPSVAPALLFSGEADPIVPPVWGETALERFANGLHVVVPGIGHNTSHIGCVPELIAEFIDAGTADGLDVRCVDTVQRPPFILGAYGPEP